MDHYTSNGQGAIGSISTYEQAIAAHHLASADPEVDGRLTGAEHEAKYSLDRAGSSTDTSPAEPVGEPETAVDEPAAEQAVPAQPELAVDTQGYETAS